MSRALAFVGGLALGFGLAAVAGVALTSVALDETEDEIGY